MHRICHFTYRSTTRYWYHPDHLGSASWVSDKAGKGIQHLYYLPWGEELDNQRATDYASRYTFSGKERDEETGYGYFGARYYNSDLSIWLSVDPLADKYPGTSPYTYCGNNPVRLVDEDGREIGDFFSMNGKYLGNDGNNDDKVYLIGSRKDIKLIRKNHKNGKTTQCDRVTIRLQTTKQVVSKIKEVSDRLYKNNGFCEEGASVFPDGTSVDYDRGPDARYTEDGKGHLYLFDKYERDGSGVLIHGHPIGEWNDRIWPVDPNLDEADKKAALQNSMTVIIGKTREDFAGERHDVVRFYDKDGKRITTISRNSLLNINAYYSAQ